MRTCGGHHEQNHTSLLFPSPGSLLLFSSFSLSRAPSLWYHWLFPSDRSCSRTFWSRTGWHRAALLNPFQRLFLSSGLLGSSDGGGVAVVTFRVGRAGTHRWPHSSLKPPSNRDTWSSLVPIPGSPAGAAWSWRALQRGDAAPSARFHHVWAGRSLGIGASPGSQAGSALLRSPPLCAQPAGANRTRVTARGGCLGLEFPLPRARSRCPPSRLHGDCEISVQRFLTFPLTWDGMLPYPGNPVPALGRSRF